MFLSYLWWFDIEKARLSTQAAAAVKKLLPKSANNDLSSKCSWADSLRVVFPWSSALHFANTPKDACNYKNSSKFLLLLSTHLLTLSIYIRKVCKSLHTKG